MSESNPKRSYCPVNHHERGGITRADWRIVLVASLLLGSIAAADFTYSYQRQSAGGGLDRINFYAMARPNTAPDLGAKVVAEDVTVQDLLGHDLVVMFHDDFASHATPDVIGAFVPDPYHSDRTFINLLGDPSDPEQSDPSTVNVPGPRAIVPPLDSAEYTRGVPQFEITVGRLNGGVNATTANDGRGALIGVAVVPAGDPVHLFGLIGGTAGPPFAVDILAPEPTGLGLLSAAVLLLRLRRPLPARLRPGRVS